MSTRARRLRSWCREIAGLGEGLDPVRAVVLAVARAVPDPDAERIVLDEADRERAAGLIGVANAGLPDPPGGWADPWLPGLVHEQVVGVDQRSARGAWYTPEPVVRGLVALATADGLPSTASDPTCGGGAFLLALLDRYREAGIDPAEALTRVSGVDIDPGAVQTSRWSIALWALVNGAPIEPGTAPVRVGDSLGAAAGGGGADGPGSASGAHLVIGNPPFATPLRSGRMPQAAEGLREANRDLLGPYSDLAAIHLLAAIRSVGPGSTVALVLPQSFLSGRDTAGLRHHCDQHVPLQALWACREAVFDAGVRACAVVVRLGGTHSEGPTLAAGPDVALVHRDDRSESGVHGDWGVHAARALGAPTLPPALGRPSRSARGGGDGGYLGDLVSATAGFRDEYYGMVEACREWEGTDAEPNRLVSVGLIDPLSSGWGRDRARFGGRQWVRPVIDLDALPPRVRAWVERRLEPKVVLATQSKVLEPVVDREGRLVPATPLISVSADPDDLARVAAVLLAPPVVAWAWQRWFGSAMSVDALKLAARQVLELPLPADRPVWDEAAALVAGADQVESGEVAQVVDRVATLMNRAYRADDEVLAWWRARRPSPQ